MVMPGSLVVIALTSSVSLHASIDFTATSTSVIKCCVVISSSGCWDPKVASSCHAGATSVDWGGAWRVSVESDPYGKVTLSATDVNHVWSAAATRRCPRTAMDYALPVSMCFTILATYACSSRYCSPDTAIICPIQPRKLMRVWNPPNCRIISWNSFPSGWLPITSWDFTHKGWSTVIMGFTLLWRAWLQSNCRVEKDAIQISRIHINHRQKQHKCGPRMWTHMHCLHHSKPCWMRWMEIEWHVPQGVQSIAVFVMVFFNN